MLKNITKIAPSAEETPSQGTTILRDLDKMGLKVEEIVESPQVDGYHPMIISGDHFG